MSTKDTADEIIASVVAAYAARPDVTPDDIVALTAKLRSELGAAGDIGAAAAGQPAPRPAMEPALPIDQAVTEDKVFCLCCGKGFKMLKRHLGAEHDLTETEYRRMFALPDDMPLVAPSYSRRKASYAKQAGFGKYDRRQAGPGAARRADRVTS